MFLSVMNHNEWFVLKYSNSRQSWHPQHPRTLQYVCATVGVIEHSRYPGMNNYLYAISKVI